jgi:hypothetical protein
MFIFSQAEETKMTVVQRTAILVAFLGLGICAAGPAAAAGPSNTVKGGFVINPVGSVLLVEYERLLNDHLSIGGRFGRLDYDYDDGSYNETGDGNGLEVMVHFYPRGEGFKGFFLSGSLGFWDVDWEWTDPNDVPTRGTGTSDTIDLAVAVGWKIPLGSEHVYLEPSLTLGNFFSDSTETTGTQESELGFYVGAGLKVGGAF